MWELNSKERWAPKNRCFWTVALEKTLESPLDSKEIQPVHPKGNQTWIFIGRTDAEAETPILLATWCKELTHLIRPWCWKRLKAGREGTTEDGRMASRTQWIWVWASSGSWWWTGRPGMLKFMGSQRETELSDWTELNWRECRGHLVLLVSITYKKWCDMLKVRWLINYVIEWTRTVNPDSCSRAVSMTSCSLIWLTDSYLRGSIPFLVHFIPGG